MPRIVLIVGGFRASAALTSVLGLALSLRLQTFLWHLELYTPNISTPLEDAVVDFGTVTSDSGFQLEGSFLWTSPYECFDTERCCRTQA